jgi:NAD(P)-dependent dehydrogenase (short-subunit alcohol dehydrogenase family)
MTEQKGRIFIVTGANAGLGFETSKELGKQGAKVIMACRNLSKGENAKEEIQKEFPQVDLEVMEIDLSTMNSVRDFAEKYTSNFDRLDVLINNAGVMMPPYTKTEDGFELQFAANYLGHFLLTGLLLDHLTKTPDSRIVNLSSIAHKSGKINFDDLQSEKKYSASGAYSQSKLACLMFNFELQRRLESKGHNNTIGTAAHPGVALTSLMRHMPKWVYYMLRYTAAPFVTQSASRGAEPTLMAAIGKADGGDYFGPTGFKEMKGDPGKAEFTELSKDEDIAKRLWKKSEELVKFSYL